MHYKVGGAVPSNPCTGSYAGTFPDNSTTGANLMHFAVQATTSGYVALGFAQTAGVMGPADVILGWAPDNGDAPYVDTFNPSTTALSEANRLVGWAHAMGASRTGGVVTVCFSRALDEPAAAVAKMLDPSQTLNLNWAVSPSNSLVQHSASSGALLNIETGDVTTVTSKTELRIRWHGALMATGWALLLPLGALFPAHRWVLGDIKLFGLHVWFQLHVALQCLGFALMTAGFAVAWFYLGDNLGRSLTDVYGPIGNAHMVLGTIVFAMACVQLLSGFARPAVDSPNRPYFTHGHRWWGRVTTVAAWTTCYLGISMFHNGIYAASLTDWIVPVAVSMGFIVLLDVIFTLVEVINRISADGSSNPSDSIRSFDDPEDAKERNSLTMAAVPSDTNNKFARVTDHPSSPSTDGRSITPDVAST